MMIMYDEPFTGLDPISKAAIVQLIHQLNRALDLTSIVVSHDVQETAAISDYMYVISEGKVVGHGTPQALRETHSAWVRQFMEGLPDGPVPFHYPAADYAEDLLASNTG
jgi:phospholipid/cholesterol/gamma-HCH transport system ATP-binding protein